MAIDPIAPYRGVHPQLAAGAWVHPRATVIGEVSLGRDASVWPGAVIRGDVNSIAIGEASNIQDNSVLHVSHKTPANPAGGPLIIGARVTVGHGVILHACTIEDECLIGMGSILLDGAVVQQHVLLGAGSLGELVEVVRGLPSNQSPFYAPVIHPTLRTGVHALVTAAHEWLGV